MSDYRTSDYTVRVAGWHGKEKHTDLRTWVESVPGASFDKNCARSFISGDTYYHNIIFQTEEDKLICKIIFGEMVV